LADVLTQLSTKKFLMVYDVPLEGRLRSPVA